VSVRKQLQGTTDIELALKRDEPLQRIVVRREANGDGVTALRQLAERTE
jgi:hypothetical protein